MRRRVGHRDARLAGGLTEPGRVLAERALGARRCSVRPSPCVRPSGFAASASQRGELLTARVVIRFRNASGSRGGGKMVGTSVMLIQTDSPVDRPKRHGAHHLSPRPSSCVKDG